MDISAEAANYALSLYEKGFGIHYLARIVGVTPEQMQKIIDQAADKRSA